MDKIILILTLIITICTILSIITAILFTIYKWKNTESFWNLDDYGTKSNDCYSLDNQQCLEYSNCGLCKDKHGHTKCVFGDHNGPYFKLGCDKWKYRDYYEGHIYDQVYDSETRPYDYWITDWRLGLADPISRSSTR